MAVRDSMAATAGVVTAAAVVMVCVFALFGTLSSLELKQAGVGLAAAVLVDATLIRAVPVARPGELVPPRRLQAPQGAPTLRSTRANSSVPRSTRSDDAADGHPPRAIDDLTPPR